MHDTKNMNTFKRKFFCTKLFSWPGMCSPKAQTYTHILLSENLPQISLKYALPLFTVPLQPRSHCEINYFVYLPEIYEKNRWIIIVL